MNNNRIINNTMSIFNILNMVMDEHINIINVEQQSFENEKSTEIPTHKEYIENMNKINITRELENEDHTCCICFDKFKLNENVYKLECGHYFHDGSNVDCGGIIKWLETNNTCPTCRYKFPEQTDPEQTDPEQINYEQTDPEQINYEQTDGNPEIINEIETDENNTQNRENINSMIIMDQMYQNLVEEIYNADINEAIRRSFE
tara:strand:- start:3075 stop:3683 length:609 start_codon:yes stop_codon:yes gene_type:complete